MRLTGLGQYTKGLAHHNPVEATALENRLDRIKWRLWHGDADEALTRAEQLAGDVAALDSGYPRLPRLIKATADLAGYIADNAAALPDYSARWFNGERISTAFVESTVNLVVSRRFAKKESNRNRGAAQAAAANGASWTSLAGMAGYQDVNRSWSVPSRVRVRVCRRRWAPFFDHCICCFLAKRRLTTRSTVDSAKAVEMISPWSHRCA